MLGRTILTLSMVLGTTTAAAADEKQLREENLRLREKIVELEKRLLESEKKALEEMRQRLRSEIEARTFKARCIELEERVREVTRELEKIKSLGTAPKKPEAGNPPAENVQGEVTEVDAAEGLFRLSIGSDVGLEKGQVLHAFRLDPKPEKARYLGKVEVLVVRPKEAVARFVGKPTVPVQKGDRVASRLQGAEKK